MDFKEAWKDLNRGRPMIPRVERRLINKLIDCLTSIVEECEFGKCIKFRKAIKCSDITSMLDKGLANQFWNVALLSVWSELGTEILIVNIGQSNLPYLAIFTDVSKVREVASRYGLLNVRIFQRVVNHE